MHDELSFGELHQLQAGLARTARRVRFSGPWWPVLGDACWVGPALLALVLLAPAPLGCGLAPSLFAWLDAAPLARAGDAVNFLAWLVAHWLFVATGIIVWRGLIAWRTGAYGRLAVLAVLVALPPVLLYADSVSAVREALAARVDGALPDGAAPALLLSADGLRLPDILPLSLSPRIDAVGTHAGSMPPSGEIEVHRLVAAAATCLRFEPVTKIAAVAAIGDEAYCEAFASTDLEPGTLWYHRAYRRDVPECRRDGPARWFDFHCSSLAGDVMVARDVIERYDGSRWQEVVVREARGWSSLGWPVFDPRSEGLGARHRHGLVVGRLTDDPLEAVATAFGHREFSSWIEHVVGSASSRAVPATDPAGS